MKRWCAKCFIIVGLFLILLGIWWIWSNNENMEMQPIPVEQPACRITGCSAQLCTDTDEVFSTCEWSEAYACYRTATCERQANGECGWTLTPDLIQCLNDAGAVIED